MTKTTILSIFVTNLGKYNEGELVGEWLNLPATDEEIEELMERIGIDGKQYEEFFITDFESDLGITCGEIDNLKQYYENGGISNRRYFRFDKEHSLIAGALRNGNFETVDYLLSVGETVNGESEQQEMAVYYNNRVVKAAENLVDYYRYHYKNLTNKQYELFDDLKEILKQIKP